MSQELLEVALDAARQAAQLVRERQADGVSVAATKSSDVDVVTQADRDSESLVRATIRAARPDDAFLGEEGDDEAGTSGVRWIIDPIDGTVNFLYGLPEYAVSIAAEVHGVVVAGVVVNAATGVEYLAHRDGDTVISQRDGSPLSVRATVPLAQRLLATGFSYEADAREVQARALVTLLPQVRDIRRHGSCALELCHVAEGRLDGYYEAGVHLWDYAAGALVAEGAGARVAQLRGFGGKTLVVCGPAAGYRDLEDAVLAAGLGAD